MVSTQSKPFPTIPRKGLMKRLNEKTRSRIVRSDWLHLEDNPAAPDPLPDAVPPRPTELPEGFTQGEFWYDCFLKV